MPTLVHILDLAIALAVLTQVVSLLDFVLLPVQKNRVEAWCDDLTLRLSFVNTAGWLQRWICTSRRAEIGKAVFAIISVLVVLGSTIVFAILIFSTGFDWIGLGLVIFLMFMQMWAWSFVDRVFNNVSPFVFEILSEAKTVCQFVIIYLATAVIGFVIVAALGLVLGWLLESVNEDGHLFRLLKFSSNFYLGLVVTWLVLFIDGLFTLTIAFILWLFSLSILFAQAFMWRVSSYKKGPVAALMLVTTATIAILRIWLKSE